jgi:hypothetical protein
MFPTLPAKSIIQRLEGFIEAGKILLKLSQRGAQNIFYLLFIASYYKFA